MQGIVSDVRVDKRSAQLHLEVCEKGHGSTRAVTVDGNELESIEEKPMPTKWPSRVPIEAQVPALTHREGRARPRACGSPGHPSADLLSWHESATHAQ